MLVAPDPSLPTNREHKDKLAMRTQTVEEAVISILWEPDAICGRVFHHCPPRFFTCKVSIFLEVEVRSCCPPLPPTIHHTHTHTHIVSLSLSLSLSLSVSAQLNTFSEKKKRLSEELV